MKAGYIFTESLDNIIRHLENYFWLLREFEILSCNEGSIICAIYCLWDEEDLINVKYHFRFLGQYRLRKD